MRISMNVIKNEHGVFHVRKKVPKKLEEATATVMGSSKHRVAWLKKSLGTKDLKAAKVRATPVLMEFDRILAEAEALLVERPLRTSLELHEIERIADYFFASELAGDEEDRREGGSEQLFQDVARQLSEAGIDYETPYQAGVAPPKFGLSDREMLRLAETLDWTLPAAQKALARADISHIQWEVDELLKVFRINLDPSSSAYRELGMAVLKAYVRSLHAIALRNRGEPVETPKIPDADNGTTAGGESLKAAYIGWKKAREPSPTTLREFTYAIDRFIELHGDMPVEKIARKHVREFREALQELPVRRGGKLLGATLPELAEWSKKHPGARRVSAATVNKLLGGVQAVVVWARDNGLIPDHVPWADPFSNMRLDEPEPVRAPWEPNELRVLFGSSVFTKGDRPKAGRGEAAFWLPLLGLFTGARLGEIAPLSAADVKTDELTNIHSITITEDPEQGRRLKTTGSRRVVPVHPELVRIGLIEFVERIRQEHGGDARLFPLLTPGPRGGFGEAWSKWFGRYIRQLGITNKALVFHSFRHGFKDALRAAGVSEDVNDALTGHAGAGTVGRSYGAKDMLKRFGLPILNGAVAKVCYPGFDLSRLRS
jgi:integrase